MSAPVCVLVAHPVRGGVFAAARGDRLAELDTAARTCRVPVFDPAAVVQSLPDPRPPTEGDDGNEDAANAENRVLCGAYDASGARFVACYENKLVAVFETHSWAALGCARLVKKATSACFVPAGDSVLVADKTGDVLRFAAPAADAPHGTAELPRSVLLGHLSMVLDVLVPAEGDVVLTADRDEKIRVSRYPRAHNIEAYCLGHSEFVSRIVLVPAMPGALISGGGDGTVRLWNYRTARQLGVYSPAADAPPVACIACARREPLAMAAWEGEGASTVEILRLDGALSSAQSLDVGGHPTALAVDANDTLWVAAEGESAPLVRGYVRGDDGRVGGLDAVRPLAEHGWPDARVTYAPLPADAALAEYLSRVKTEALATSAQGRLPRLAQLKKRMTRVNVEQYMARKETRLSRKRKDRDDDDAPPEESSES